MLVTYHHIIPKEKIPKTNNKSEGWEWSITPEQFIIHIKKLHKKGYKFVSIDEKIKEIKQKGKERYKTVVLTFDDGWIDNYYYAFPILKEYKIPAVFYVTTEHIYNKTNDPRKVSLPFLKELINNDITIGSHTRYHSNLSKLNDEELNIELKGSKADLEEALGIEVKHLAYPGGAFNSKVSKFTKAAGYCSASSILSPSTNTKNDIFWLYRNHFTENMNKLSDWYRINFFLRQIGNYRVRKKLNRKLHG